MAAMVSNSINGRTRQQLHIVIVPYPVQGHINPAMQLAKKLLAHDDSIIITFVNNRHNHERLVKAGSSSASSDVDDQRLRLLWIDDGLPADFDYADIGSKFVEMYQAVEGNMLRQPFEDLLLSLTDPAPDFVILGSFCNAARDVAGKLGIPAVVLWTQSAAVFDIYLHVRELADSGFFPYSKLDKSKLISCIPGIPPIEPRCLPSHLHCDDEAEFRLKVATDYFATIPTYRAVLMNSFQQLEHIALTAMVEELHHGNTVVFPVGPLLPDAAFTTANSDSNNNNSDVRRTVIRSGSSLLDERTDCIYWLDTKPESSVLYISFGSLFNPSMEQTTALAMGIKASKQPFLWVMRPRASVSHVSELFPQGFLEEEDGLVIPWAPQLEVLSHPAVGAFLTHCGWNSTLESVSMGMPLITFPVTLDQPTNSKFLVDVWRIGVTIASPQDLAHIESRDVEAAIAIMFCEEGQKMRVRAKALRDEASKAVQMGGTSYAAIDKFISLMKGNVNKDDENGHQ